MTEEQKRQGRRTGRPSTGLDIQMMMRVSTDFLRSIDEWRERQFDRPPRAVAIRRLVDLGLAATAATETASTSKTREPTAKKSRVIPPKAKPVRKTTAPRKARSRRPA